MAGTPVKSVAILVSIPQAQSAAAGTRPTNNNPGSLVQVTVTYQLNFAIPFLPMSPPTITASSAMVISQ